MLERISREAGHRGECINVDISRTAAEHAHSGGLNSVVADAGRLGIGSERASAVSAGFVFDSLDRPKDAIAELYRVMEEDGVAVLRFHHRSDPAQLEEEISAAKSRLAGHKEEKTGNNSGRRLSAEETTMLDIRIKGLENMQYPGGWRGLLEKTGFRIEEEKIFSVDAGNGKQVDVAVGYVARKPVKKTENRNTEDYPPVKPEKEETNPATGPAPPQETRQQGRRKQETAAGTPASMPIYAGPPPEWMRQLMAFLAGTAIGIEKAAATAENTTDNTPPTRQQQAETAGEDNPKQPYPEYAADPHASEEDDWLIHQLKKKGLIGNRAHELNISEKETREELVSGITDSSSGEEKRPPS